MIFLIHWVMVLMRKNRYKYLPKKNSIIRAYYACVIQYINKLFNKQGEKMKLGKILLGSALLSSMLLAGGDIEPVIAEEPVVETSAWSFELEPYLMITNIEGDTSLGRVVGTPVDVDFGTILDNLDMAFMGHFEAHHQSGWGFWIDYGFMDLSNDVAAASLIELVEVRQGVLEVMGLYRQTLSSGYIEYLAGIRWWDNDFDIYVSPSVHAIDRSIDWVDGVVGLRYTHILNENWKLRVHGDIGAGGSDLTYATTAGVIYTINDLLDVDVKYKATWVDYEESELGLVDYFSYDTVTHGLVLGLNFKF